jgi:SIR2-like domain
MKLILFLGSGVSLKSGLPTVADLTLHLLDRVYHQDSYNHFSPGYQPDPHLGAADVMPRIRRLLELLTEHDQGDIERVGYSPSIDRSSGAIFRGASTTYEDLFYLCEQIRLWNIGLVDNSLVTPLMEIIERNAGELLAGGSTMARLSDLGSLAEKACFFIESVVAEELRPKDIVGLDLLLELATAPYIEQLNIVTLNHDTLVEQFLAENGVDFVDGFGERDGDVRWYDESVYDDSHARVKILKLHGSVNWYSFAVNGRLRPAIFLGTDVSNTKDGKGVQLTLQFRRPSFLSGISKAVSYQRGIYADTHFRFHQLLRQCKQIVMSGYGWGDIAINFQLDTWLDQDRQNAIILLHETPEQLVDRSLIMATGYDFWTQSGQLIPIPKWLSEASLSDIEDHFVATTTH